MKIEETEIELFEDLSISLVMAIKDGKPIAQIRLLRKYAKDSPNSFLASLVGGGQARSKPLSINVPSPPLKSSTNSPLLSGTRSLTSFYY